MLLLIVISSIGLKILFAAKAADPSLVGEKMLIEFLQRQGFTLVSRENDSVFFVRLRFHGSDCKGDIQAALLPPDRSADRIFKESLKPGEKLFLVYRGRVVQRAPDFAFILDRFYLRAEEFGLGQTFLFSPYLGIIEPGQCGIEGSLPWHELVARSTAAAAGR